MYVYIFEDGTTQQHPEPPTKTDKAMIADGTLLVLKASNVKYVTETDELDDLETCDYEDEGGGLCHFPS